MARFRLELGPIPFYHQVYLDLRGMIDDGRWPAGHQRPARARARAPVRRQRHHGSPRAGRARPRAAHGAHARPRHVRACRAHRPRPGRAAQRSREEMQTRGLDPETRLVAARPEVGRRSRRRGARAGARFADALPRAAARCGRRSAAARAGAPARRALPRACSPATSSTARSTGLLTERYGTHVARARETFEPVLCAPARQPCWGSSRARRPCSSKASPSPMTAPRRVRPHLRPRRSHPLLRRTHRPHQPSIATGPGRKARTTTTTRRTPSVRSDRDRGGER